MCSVLLLIAISLALQEPRRPASCVDHPIRAFCVLREDEGHPPAASAEAAACMAG